MIQIPKQLINCRFIKTNEKKPIEERWTTTFNYSYDDFKPSSSTYGVATGFNRLVVIDCDKQYIQDKLMEIEQFRNTFTVRTAGKKLYHFYFFVDIDEPKGFKLHDKNTETILDFQCQGQQVIGPGSILSTGESYDVVNDVEIMQVPYDFLKNILYNIDDNVKISTKKDKSDIKAVYTDFDDTCVKIKERVKVIDILLQHGIEAEKDKNCKCPLGHTSEGGECFSFTNNVWFCFHCYQTGNIFHLIQKIKKINFIEAKQLLSIKAGISNETNIYILNCYKDPKTKHIASEKIAQEFKKLHKAHSIRGDKDIEIYIYKEGIYVSEGKTYIKEYVRDILGEYYNENFTKQVIDKIIVDNFIEKDRFFINEDVNLIPVQNGILNISTLEIEDFNSQYRFFNKLPVIFDPRIKPDKCVEFIKDIVQTEEEFLTIQELAGYLLFRDNIFEKSFMLSGDGRNGKGKLILLFVKLLGEENITNVSLTALENNNFSIINLHNKYANFSPDLNDEALSKSEVFKSITGRDNITADRKFKESIAFRCYAKMVFAANKMPEPKDKTKGFWSRWVLLNFPFEFVDNPDPKKTYQKKRDIELINKITTSKEMSGFLNWSLEGLHRLLKNKQFTKKENYAELELQWIGKSSSFAKFWMDEIEFTDNLQDVIYREDVMDCYDEYCNNFNLEKEGYKKIYNFLIQKCLYKRVKQQGEVVYVLKKVKFKKYIPDKKSDEVSLG